MCSMVLEYVSTFAPQNHPNIGKYTHIPYMEHLGIQQVSVYICLYLSGWWFQPIWKHWEASWLQIGLLVWPHLFFGWWHIVIFAKSMPSLLAIYGYKTNYITEPLIFRGSTEKHAVLDNNMSQLSLCLGIKVTNPQSTTSYEVFPLSLAESHLGEMSAQFWGPFRKIYPAPGLKSWEPRLYRVKSTANVFCVIFRVCTHGYGSRICYQWTQTHSLCFLDICGSKMMLEQKVQLLNNYLNFWIKMEDKTWGVSRIWNPVPSHGSPSQQPSWAILHFQIHLIWWDDITALLLVNHDKSTTYLCKASSMRCITHWQHMFFLMV